MIHLTVDDKKIEAQEGTSILRAARAAGIEIPHLCEFEHLSPHGGCRMCFIDIEGVATLQTSCTYPVQEGLVVHTNTPKVYRARKFVLSLLFSDRNHFCMYCPATNGDCELQEAAYQLEMDHWSIQPSWERYEVDSSHPWLVWDQNRCILCQRCVRACTELSGQHTIVPKNRGASLLLTTDNNLPWGESSCVKCGTCYQVCPTGAIMDRRSAYMGNTGQSEKQQAICVECGLGCSTEVYTKSNQLQKIEGDWDGQVNHGVLCEKGRFKVVAALEQSRIMAPMAKRNGKLVEISWEEAIEIVLSIFNHKPCAALISARLPIEALYQFRSLFIALGCDRIASSENGSDRYDEVLSVIDEPKQAVISPNMFGKRGKANSRAVHALGFEETIDGANKPVFLVIGDDPDVEAYQVIADQASFLVVQATYQTKLTENSDIVLPSAHWAEEGGHYLNLIDHLQYVPTLLNLPDGVYSSEAIYKMIAEEAEITLPQDWQKALFAHALEI